MNKLLLTLILFTILLPLSVNAITVDPNWTTFDIGTVSATETVIEIVQWVLGVIALLCIIGIIISPILMSINQKKANQILENHHIEPKKEDKPIVEREKIILKYNHLIWFRGAGCLMLLLFIFAIQEMKFFIIYLIIILIIYFINNIFSKKSRQELAVFDKNNPGIKEKMQGNTIKILEVSPEFRDEYENLLKTKKRFNYIFATSIILLLISLMAWSIVIFTPCCATEVTT